MCLPNSKDCQATCSGQVHQHPAPVRLTVVLMTRVLLTKALRTFFDFPNFHSAAPYNDLGTISSQQATDTFGVEVWQGDVEIFDGCQFSWLRCRCCSDAWLSRFGLQTSSTLPATGWSTLHLEGGKLRRCGPENLKGSVLVQIANLIRNDLGTPQRKSPLHLSSPQLLEKLACQDGARRPGCVASRAAQLNLEIKSDAHPTGT